MSDDCLCNIHSEGMRGLDRVDEGEREGSKGVGVRGG